MLQSIKALRQEAQNQFDINTQKCIQDIIKIIKEQLIVEPNCKTITIQDRSLKASRKQIQAALAEISKDPDIISTMINQMCDIKIDLTENAT